MFLPYAANDYNFFLLFFIMPVPPLYVSVVEEDNQGYLILSDPL